jgi:multidrug efflux system outer membrane protein
MSKVSVLLALLAAGCAVGPDYKLPEPSMPAAWSGGGGPAAELATWWQQFDDPQLTALVEEAIRANLDLRIAATRLRQARAARGVAIGGFWPSVGASAAYQRQDLPGGVPPDQQSNLYQAGLDALWELDLFGGVRRSVESAGAEVEAAVENIRDVQVSLSAEVALAYVGLRGFQQEVLIAQENLESQRRSAEITRRRFSAGFVSGLDTANADASAFTTEAQIPVLEAGARQSIHALSVLLARPPGELLAELTPAGPLPVVPEEIPSSLPSDLLRRRPDIRAAEAQLHSATAQIGVATADLFPRFSLTGNANWQSDLLSSWWTPAGRSLGVGPSLSWALFQGGAIRSNIHLQEALRDESFLDYQKTVLGALQEVEDALIALAKEREHRTSLAGAVAANRKAVDLAMQLYTQGESDFLNVLVAQRSLYASEDALILSDRSACQDLVALYKALGGGWGG